MQELLSLAKIPTAECHIGKTFVPVVTHILEQSFEEDVGCLGILIIIE